MDIKDALKSIEGYDNSVKKALKSTLDLEKSLKAVQKTFTTFAKEIKAVNKQLSGLSKEKIEIKVNLNKTSLKKQKPGEIWIKAKDSATPVINKIRRSLSFTGKTYTIRINSKTDAVSSVKKLQGNTSYYKKSSKKANIKPSDENEETKMPQGGGIAGAAGMLGGIKGMLLGALANVAQNALSAIGNVLKKGIGILMAQVSEKLKQTKEWKSIADQIKIIKDVGGEVFGSVVNMLVKMGSVILSILNGPLSRFASWFEGKQAGMTGFIDNISNGFMKLVPSITEAINCIAAALSGFGTLFSNAAGSTNGFTISTDTIGKIITSVGKTIATVIELLAPILGGLWSIINIGISYLMTNIPVIMGIIQSVFSLLGPIIVDIIGILQIYMQVWSFVFTAQIGIIKVAWSIIGPILKAVWDIIMMIVDVFKILWAVSQPVIAGIMEALKPLAEFINMIADKLSRITGKFSGIVGGFREWLDKKAEDSAAKNGVKKGRSPGTYAFGLARVPYNNYPALLHEGERVLTKQESNNAGGSVTIPKLADTIVVREQADIDKIADALTRKLQQYSLNMGVA